MEEEKKICTHCKQELSYDMFYKYKSGKPWAYCRKCHYQRYTKDIKLRWDEKNPERVKEINSKAQKRWVENNREHIKKYNREWWRKNRSKKQT